MKKKVLIIDRDLSVCRELKYSLQNETTDVFYTPSVREGFEHFTKYHLCLVIIDAFLLEVDGISFLKEMRQKKPTPILILSSKNSSQERINALQSGAIGYLVKPYELKECIAHAESFMRLYTDLNIVENRCYTLEFKKDLIIDPMAYHASLKGVSLNLTRKEFDLLFCLASHASQVLSPKQLYNAVWNEELPYNANELVKAHIKSLRKKLTPAGKEYIKNKWGVGYQFYLDDEWP